MTLTVFTLKINTTNPAKDSDEDVLEALMSLFEAFGIEIVGELSYEDVKERKLKMARHNGDYYIAKASRGGCQIKYGRGDHIKVYSPDRSSMMVIPRNLHGNGLEYAIIRWLVKFGIVIVLILAFAHFLC